MTPWFYIDSWDWVLEGGKYIWKKTYFKMTQTSDINNVEAHRRVGYQSLKTAQGIVRCFAWDPDTSSWIACEEII